MSQLANESIFQDTSVAIAKEPEVLLQRVLIHFFPVGPNECCNEKQQGRLRLVEIGDQSPGDPSAVTWGDENAGPADDPFFITTMHPR